jgi:hypothetical protein
VAIIDRLRNKEGETVLSRISYGMEFARPRLTAGRHLKAPGSSPLSRVFCFPARSPAHPNLARARVVVK